MKQFQWFPGHMVRALREIEERIKYVDIVIELLDARAPLSSSNPKIQSIIQNKPNMIILTKKDLADDQITKQWQEYFIANNRSAYAINVNSFDFNIVKRQAQMVLKEKFDKEAAKGIRPRAIRALICGIPNVGKSTFINRIAKRKAAKVGNMPGITKAQQWIKVDDDFELLDTPGVLWPSFDNEEIGMRLALIGTIKSTILPQEKLAYYLMQYLSKNHPNALEKRYSVVVGPIMDEHAFHAALQQIGHKRGLLTIGSIVDESKVIAMLLKEFADGIIGRFTLESPGDIHG